MLDLHTLAVVERWLKRQWGYDGYIHATGDLVGQHIERIRSRLTAEVERLKDDGKILAGAVTDLENIRAKLLAENASLRQAVEWRAGSEKPEVGGFFDACHSTHINDSPDVMKYSPKHGWFYYSEDCASWNGTRVPPLFWRGPIPPLPKGPNT